MVEPTRPPLTPIARVVGKISNPDRHAETSASKQFWSVGISNFTTRQ
jgi:hypothetical protein